MPTIQDLINQGIFNEVLSQRIPLELRFLDLTSVQQRNLQNTIIQAYIGKELSFMEALNLTPTERSNLINPTIRKMIGDKFTFDEAKNLTENQRDFLNDEDIQELVGNGCITFEQMLNLSTLQYNILTNPKIYMLINKGLLDWGQANNLTQTQYNNILNPIIQRLISNQNLSFNEALSLTNEQGVNLQSEPIQALIGELKISIDEAKNLSENQRFNLESKSIQELINSNPPFISLQAAKDLSYLQRGTLENPDIRKKIFNKQMSIDEIFHWLKDPNHLGQDISQLEKNTAYQNSISEQIQYNISTILASVSYNQAQIQSWFLVTLRFNSIYDADKSVKQFIDNYPQYASQLDETYQLAKNIFNHSAPYCSRLTQYNHLQSLQKVYGHITNLDLMRFIGDETKYGNERKNITEELCQKISDKNYQPESKELLVLPPSASGSRKAAAVLDVISSWNFKKLQHMNFRSLREIKLEDYSTTPMSDRYQWAKPLVIAVAQFSRHIAPEQKLAKPFHEINQNIKYDLTYTPEGKSEPEILAQVNLSFDSKKSILATSNWMHGLQEVAKTWPHIENLFENLLNMDLHPPLPNATEAEKNVHNQKLHEFYSKTAELLWFIGNTQPMLRGSGSFAETILAIVHMHHGLQPPILKLDFPQLDVLDITFPLEDYKQLLPYFFEPESLPINLKLENLSLNELSPFDQMKKLYEIINQRPVLNNANILNDQSTKISSPQSTAFANSNQSSILSVDEKTSNSTMRLGGKQDS